MTIRNFILKNGIEKLNGLQVLGFDTVQTVRVTPNDITTLKDLRPREYFRLTTEQGNWIYPNDILQIN